MGAVERGGRGCICPESALLRALFTHLLLRQEDVLLLDMYAGVEYLGRATVDFVDAMLIVSEPTRRSLGTAMQIAKLARDIGLRRLYLVGNKIRHPEDAAFLQAEAELPFLGWLPADEGVAEAVAGKGGVGKTTVAALLIKFLSQHREGSILAIDADPSSNLHITLGMDLEWTVGEIREEMLEQVKASLLGGGAAMGTLPGDRPNAII